MTELAIDYATIEVSFYKFVCQNEEITSSYVGSTSNFIKRKQSHKISCNTITNPAYNRVVYQSIRENGGWDNWCMIEIEKRFVKDKREAERVEQDLIEKLQADMNMIKAIELRSIPEIGRQYYIENADKIKEKQKQYYTENTDKCKEYAEEYRKQHKDENIEYQKNYRVEQADKIKKYALENKEKIKERQRKYVEQNREKINEKKRLKRLEKKQQSI